MALPENHISKSVVRPADFDKDGDLDLFIGGRCYPWNYPKPVSSILLRNDSKNGKAKFTDVTVSIAGSLAGIGMVCDAVWSDYRQRRLDRPFARRRVDAFKIPEK